MTCIVYNTSRMLSIVGNHRDASQRSAPAMPSDSQVSHCTSSHRCVLSVNSHDVQYIPQLLYVDYLSFWVSREVITFQTNLWDAFHISDSFLNMSYIMYSVFFLLFNFLTFFKACQQDVESWEWGCEERKGLNVEDTPQSCSISSFKSVCLQNEWDSHQSW